MQGKRWIKWKNAIDVPVFLLFVIFGISSWMTINAVFVELPSLSSTVPEGWAIGSRVGIAIQCANIPAFIYFILVYKFEWKTRSLPFNHLNLAIWSLLALGFVTTLLISFFWANTVIFDSRPQSIPLLILTFFGGIVDCTTTLVYWPFVSSYSDIYTSALAAGEGLSGASVSLIGLIQNQGPHPRFGPSLFFGLASGWMILSALAFGGLLLLRKRQVNSIQDDVKSSEALLTPPSKRGDPSVVKASKTARDHWWLFLLQIFLNAIGNGMIPSLTTYAFLNYFDGKFAMSLAINIGLIVNPLAALASGLFKCPPWVLWILTGITAALSTFMIYVSAMSPHPPLMSSHSAAWLMFTVFVCLNAVISYAKAVIFINLKEPGSDLNVELRQHNERMYRIGGLMTQIGALISSVLFFFLVNYSNVFKSN